MSGHNSRMLYDACNTCENAKISTASSKWVHNTSNEHNGACFSRNGPREGRVMASSSQNVNYRSAVDIESSLKGLDIPSSRCMTGQNLIDKDKRLNKL